MRRLTISLTDNQHTDIERAVEEEHGPNSKSEFVRNAIRDYLQTMNGGQSSQERYAEAQSRISDLEQKNVELQDELREVTDRIEELKSQNESLRNSLTEKRKQNNKLEEELEIAHSQIQSVNREQITAKELTEIISRRKNQH
jgi:Arc/MetJ-type ribon-helix-helix transcriptional regulator